MRSSLALVVFSAKHSWLFTTWQDVKQVVGRHSCSVQTPPLSWSWGKAHSEHNVLRTGCIHQEKNKRTAQVRALVAGQRCYLWSRLLVHRSVCFLPSARKPARETGWEGCRAQWNCNPEFLPHSFFLFSSVLAYITFQMLALQCSLKKVIIMQVSKVLLTSQVLFVCDLWCHLEKRCD